MPAALASNALIAEALPNAQAWLARFQMADIPVLEETAETLSALSACQDDVDARLIASCIGNDPLMTLRLLVHMGQNSRRATDVETVTGALVLLGISPFFANFGQLPTVESRLQERPEALAGLGRVLRRAQRAATFALGFAVHRMDHDATVIHEAALLHDFAEMLLWCHAPALALEVERRLAADRHLRSADVQREVLGVALTELQPALMRAWHLPELLIQLEDDRHADTAAVKNVVLASRLARHTAAGWDNAAVPDDVHDISELLCLGTVPTMALLRDLDPG